MIISYSFIISSTISHFLIFLACHLFFSFFYLVFWSWDGRGGKRGNEMVGENIWDDDGGRSWDGFYDEMRYDKLWEMRWEMTSYHLILPSLLFLFISSSLISLFTWRRKDEFSKWDEIRLRWERDGRWWDWLYYFSSMRWWLVGWLMIFFFLSFIFLSILQSSHIYFLVFFTISLSLSLYLWDGWSSWDGWLIIVKNCEKDEMMMNFSSFLSHHLFPYPSYHKIDLHLFFDHLFLFL